MNEFLIYEQFGYVNAFILRYLYKLLYWNWILEWADILRILRVSKMAKKDKDEGRKG